MKPRPRAISVVVALCCIAAQQFVASQAQTTDPPYLSQFPATSRIRNEIKGFDAIDASARIMAAFDVLIDTVRKMSGAGAVYV